MMYGIKRGLYSNERRRVGPAPERCRLRLRASHPAKQGPSRCLGLIDTIGDCTLTAFVVLRALAMTTA